MARIKGAMMTRKRRKKTALQQSLYTRQKDVAFSGELL